MNAAVNDENGYTENLNDGVGGTNETYDAWLMEFIKAHNEKYKSDNNFVNQVGRKILEHDTSGDPNVQDLKSKIDHWLANSDASMEEKSVAKDFKTFVVNDGLLPERNVIDAGDVGVPGQSPALKNSFAETGPEEEKPVAPKTGPDGLAQGGAQLAGALANSVGAGLSKLSTMITKPVGAAVSHVSTVKAQKRVETNTTAAITAMGSMKEIAEKDGAELRKQIDAFKALPADQREAARSSFTDNFVNKLGEASEKIKASSTSQARLNADPTIASKFKRSEKEIAEDADEVTTKMNRLAEEARKLLGDDTQNVDKIKAAQKMLEEMFENIKKMIKAIFSGFGANEPAKAPAPRPS